jgi:NAD(P)-dependent dehydrogenase (short-subunit alcohol dehydrogenase family)
LEQIMRTWFITGASRGFGALIAKEALGKGDAVVASARNPKTVLDCIGDHPNLLAVALDVTNEAHAHAAAKEAIERFGRIDVLVNHAGYGLLGTVEEATTEEIEAIYRTNVFGLISVTHAVLPHMRRQRSGRILNISSIADYAETSGVMRDFAGNANHRQPGDPAKLARVLVAFADAPNPPFVCHSAAIQWLESRLSSPQRMHYWSNDGRLPSLPTTTRPSRPQPEVSLSKEIS